MSSNNLSVTFSWFFSDVWTIASRQQFSDHEINLSDLLHTALNLSVCYMYSTTDFRAHKIWRCSLHIALPYSRCVLSARVNAKLTFMRSYAVQFRSYLLTCKHNSPETNYKVSMSKNKEVIKKHLTNKIQNKAVYAIIIIIIKYQSFH